MIQTAFERFYSKVLKADGNACWEWQGYLFPTGHGQFWLNGRDIKASRAAWILHNGHVSPKDYVCHTCDNARCVRIDHLYLGTHQTNMRDVKERQRRRWVNSPHNKLTWADVAEIRASVDAPNTLAGKFGVSRTTIDRVLKQSDVYWPESSRPQVGA